MDILVSSLRFYRIDMGFFLLLGVILRCPYPYCISGVQLEQGKRNGPIQRKVGGKPVGWVALGLSTVLKKEDCRRIRPNLLVLSKAV